jgi:acrosin
MATDGSVLRRWINKPAKNTNGRELKRGQQHRRARLFEGLESRVLFTTITQILLDGTSLTTSFSDGTHTTSVVANPSNQTLAGDISANNIIVQNFSGNVTINGGGGGDQITINSSGTGATTTVQGATNADALTVRAPASILANVTVGSTAINVGTDTVNYPSTLGGVSVVGQLFTTGDTLTINGTSSAESITVNSAKVQMTGRPDFFYSTFTQLTVNGAGGGDTFTIAGDSIKTFVTAGSGNADFTVQTNGVALALTGSTSGTDHFTVTSNAGPLTITGQGAANFFTVNASAAATTINGGTTTNTYTVNANSASLTLNGGGTSNNVTVVANSGTIGVNGGTGTDSFEVESTGGQVTLSGGAGATTTYDIAAPTVGPVTVIGNAGSPGVLTFHGTTQPDVFTVTSSTLSAGVNSTVTYSHLTGLVVDGVSGNDTFLVTSAATPTTIEGQTGNNTFNIRANTALLTLDTGTGTNTINIGSNAPGITGNLLSTIAAGVVVTGSGTDILNLNDEGDASPATVLLTSTGFTGVGAGITYSGAAALNIKLGSGGNTLDVDSTPSGTATSINLGTGTNSGVITSTAPTTGGNLDGLLGTLSLTGSSADDLLVDDTGSATPKTASMNATTITGLSPAAISYAGFATLTVGLGTAGDDFSILNTNATTGTTVHGGAGDDTLRIINDSGVTSLTTGGGSDIIAVQATGAAATTTITTLSGNAAIITIGSNAPGFASGVLSGIASPVTVNGTGSEILLIDDTGDTSAATGAVSPTAVTGFGLAAGGVTYSSVALLDIRLGSGGNTVTVSDTTSTTTTHITGGSGADVVTITQDSGPTNVSTAGGDDVINVRAINGMTTVNGGAGTDVINVSSSATPGSGVVDGITTTLTVQGSGTTTTLTIDDGGNTVGKTVALSGTAVTGLSTGAIDYSGVTALNLTTGSGADTLTINSTSAPSTIATGGGADTVTVMGTSNLVILTTGAGNDSIDVRATGAELDIDAGADDNSIIAGSNGSGGNGVLSGIVGLLKITGGAGANTVSLDDSGDTSDTTATMDGTTLTGLNPGGIEYHSISSITVNLGSGGDTFNITDTITGTTEIDANDGDDTFNVQATDGDTTVDTGTGTNTINVGSDAPTATTSVLDNIAGTLTVTGSGSDTLNLQDVDNTTDKTGVLTSGAVTGLSPADIDYTGLATLNVLFGSGANTFTISSTASGTATNVTTNGGGNTINVETTSSATTLNLSGLTANIVNVHEQPTAITDGIAGLLTIHGGSGSDQVSIDDSGNTVGKTVTISSGAVSGISPADIDFDTIGTLSVKLGSGADVVTITDSSAALTVNTGAGDDSVNIQQTTQTLDVQNSGGTDTVRIGSTAPTSGGVLAQINGEVTVTGNGGDTLDVDDSGNSSASTGLWTSTALTGLSPADIDYSGLAHMDVHQGLGNDTLNIASTASGTANTLSTGGGVNQINIGAIIGQSTSVSGILGTVSVTGSGSDVLNIDDHGASVARTGTMTASNVTLANANVTYSGLANLNLTFAPSTTFGVLATAAGVSTSILSTSGAVTVGGAGASNLTTSVSGPLSITGGGQTDVTVDDSGDSTGRSLILNATTVTGLSPAVITYTTAKTLSILTGTGADQVTVNATHANPTTINTGSGNDTVSVRVTTGTLSLLTGTGSNAVTISSLSPTLGGVMNTIAAAVTVTGTGGTTALTVDDSGDSTGQTVQLTTSAVVGLNPGDVTLVDVSTLAVLLGTGADTVTVTGTAIPASVNAGAGDDAVTVNGPGVGALLSLDGADGTNALTVNGGGSGTVTLTDTSITGLPQEVDYVNFATLALNLGASQSLQVNNINPTTVTTISVPSGQGSVNLPGDLNGQLSLGNLSGGTFSVGGNINGTVVIGSGVLGLTVGGSLAGSVSIGGNGGTVSIGNDLSGTLAIAGGADSLAIGNDLSGTLTVAGAAGSMTVGNDLSGTATIGGSLPTLNIGGSLTSTGQVVIQGNLGTMLITGADAGSIQAVSVGFIGVGRATPGTNGTMFSVTQAGVYRSVRATIAEGVAASGVTAQVAYDGSTSIPEVAVRLANIGPRFDFIVEAPANSSGFNLTRVDSTNKTIVGVRNIDVDGSLLNTGPTASQANYFGEQMARAAGVNLPADKLAAVSVTGAIPLYAIRAFSVQAIAFAHIGRKAGSPWTATATANNARYQDQILVGALAINPKTGLPTTKIANVTETLRVVAGVGKPVGLFIGRTAKLFAGQPSYFSDKHIDVQTPVVIDVKYAKQWLPLPVITNMTFLGDGGSVDTNHMVQNITSTGPLGDVTLRAGKYEFLKTLTAPKMFGKFTLARGGQISKSVMQALKSLGKK